MRCCRGKQAARCCKEPGEKWKWLGGAAGRLWGRGPSETHTMRPLSSVSPPASPCPGAVGSGDPPRTERRTACLDEAGSQWDSGLPESESGNHWHASFLSPEGTSRVSPGTLRHHCFWVRKETPIPVQTCLTFPVSPSPRPKNLCGRHSSSEIECKPCIAPNVLFHFTLDPLWHSPVLTPGSRIYYTIWKATCIVF